MNEITSNAASPASASRLAAASAAASGRQSETATPPAAAPARDEVELSDAAKYLSRLRETPEIRQEKVDRVKAEIASGTYLTPDKIDRAADNLSEDLDLFA